MLKRCKRKILLSWRLLELLHRLLATTPTDPPLSGMFLNHHFKRVVMSTLSSTLAHCRCCAENTALAGPAWVLDDEVSGRPPANNGNRLLASGKCGGNGSTGHDMVTKIFVQFNILGRKI